MSPTTRLLLEVVLWGAVMVYWATALTMFRPALRFALLLASAVAILALGGKLAFGAPCPRGERPCAPEWYAERAGSEVGEAIAKAARAADLDPALALALWKTETECSDSIQCSAGNCGPLQVLFSTWRKPLGLATREDLYGPAGARIGVEVLRRFAARFRPRSGAHDRCRKHGDAHGWVAHYKCGNRAEEPACVRYARMTLAHVPGFHRALEER